MPRSLGVKEMQERGAEHAWGGLKESEGELPSERGFHATQPGGPPSTHAHSKN